MNRTEDDLRAVYAERTAVPDIVTIEHRLIATARALGGSGATDANRYRRRPTRTWVAIAGGCVAVAAVTVAVTVGVSHLGSPPTAAPPGGRAPTAADLSFPLDAYRPTPEQSDALRNAEFTLANECATSYGVAVHLPTNNNVARSDFIALYAASIRPVTLADARQDGYHMPPSGTSVADAIIGTLSPADRDTVHGCINSASAQLTGGNPDTSTGSGLLASDQMYVDNQLIAVSVSQALSDSKLTDTYHAWSTCMANAGYPNLKAPRDAIEAANLDGSPSPGEVREAATDVGCKNGARVTTTWAQLVRTSQEQMIAQHSQKLDSIQARLQAALARAATVLGR